MEKKNYSLSYLDRLALSRDDCLYLIENISLLLASGVSVLPALESLSGGRHKKNFQKLLSVIREDIESGVSFSDALERTHLFPEYTIVLARLGELSGTLPENLKLASSQENKSLQFKSKIRSALMYPLFVMVMAVIVGGGVAWFILPKLSAVFTSLNIPLPYITRVLIGAGDFFKVHGAVVIPLAFLLFLFLLILFFFYPRTKWMGEHILLRLPGFGDMIRQSEIARMTYMLGSLLKAGFPITDAMNASQEASSITVYTKFYKHLGEHLENGDTFAQSFDSYGSIEILLPKSVEQVIITGSQSGSLSDSLVSISGTFNEKAETSAKNLTVILEPVLLVIVWLGVVGIALAVILPLYKLIGSLNG